MKCWGMRNSNSSSGADIGLEANDRVIRAVMFVMVSFVQEDITASNWTVAVISCF